MGIGGVHGRCGLIADGISPTSFLRIKRSLSTD
jgi:hypothetical protein